MRIVSQIFTGFVGGFIFGVPTIFIMRLFGGRHRVKNRGFNSIDRFDKLRADSKILKEQAREEHASKNFQ